MTWKKLFYSLVIIPVLIIFTVNARGEDGQIAKKLIKGERHKVIRIIDGDTVILDNHASVRLVGIQAPKIALGRPGFKDWPLGKEAKAALSRMVLGQHVTLYYGGARQDRYERILAHLFLDDDRWVQGMLLKAGFARVYSFPDNRSIITDMLQREKQAEKDRRGIWGHAFFQSRPQENTLEYLDSFQLVHGKILNIASVRGTIFLNFGHNWKKDFTIVIKPAQYRKFEKAGIHLLSLEDTTVRVRGWLRYYNGPMIEITHPEQLELSYQP